MPITSFTESIANYLVNEQDSIEAGEWDHSGRDLQSANYVQVIFPNGINANFKSAFTDAAAFWNNVITKGAAPITFSSSFNVGTNLPGCGVNFVFGAGSKINGLTIFADVSAIDGVGAILGQAGPCGFSGNFPVLGSMQFDSADVQQLLNDGTLGAVIRHEMGHVIGIGSNWGSLVSNPCTRIPCNTNPSYNGANGKQGLAILGGSGNPLVANQGGAGTVNAHWREVTFNNELMTGFLNNGNNPMSIMTVGSLFDLGYTANTNAAEAYSLPRPEDEFTPGEIEMVGDLLDIVPVDIHEAIASNEAGKADQSKFVEMGVFVAVVACLVALLAGLVAFVALRLKKQEKQISNLKQPESQVQHFGLPQSIEEQA